MIEPGTKGWLITPDGDRLEAMICLKVRPDEEVVKWRRGEGQGMTIDILDAATLTMKDGSRFEADPNQQKP